jgi:hypothetical protein
MDALPSRKRLWSAIRPRIVSSTVQTTSQATFGPQLASLSRRRIPSLTDASITRRSVQVLGLFTALSELDRDLLRGADKPVPGEHAT